MGKINGVEFDDLTWQGQQLAVMLIANSGIPLRENLPEATITVNGFVVNFEAFTKEVTGWVINVGENNYACGHRDARDQVVKAIAEAIKINIRLND